MEATDSLSSRMPASSFSNVRPSFVLHYIKLDIFGSHFLLVRQNKTREVTMDSEKYDALFNISDKNTNYIF